MRLINCKSLDALHLESFEPCNEPIGYAILSHTWEKAPESDHTSEVLFDDFQDGSHRRNKTNEAGWRKIERACREAKNFGKGLDYVWVDSCCINKKDVAELSESINSMFQWYAQSTVCFAYLSDADSDGLDPTSKWFTRGWTLQELVASPKVRFYNCDWQFIGGKFKLSDELAEITGIDTVILEATDEQSIARRLYEIPVCQKMSWASMRQTTKVEDTAYCLLGLFGIHMPLLYGEREAAFRRLQEAIANKYNDLTILAWKSEDMRHHSHCFKHAMYDFQKSELDGPVRKLASFEYYHGVFACSPRDFKQSGLIRSCFPHPSIFNSEYSITNKGLKMVSTLRKGNTYGSYMMPLLCCELQTTRVCSKRPTVKRRPLGIFLKWVGGTTYVRANCTELKSMQPGDLEQGPGQDEFFLALSMEQLPNSVNDLQRGSIRLQQRIDLSIPGTDLSIRITKVSPGFMWDNKQGIFYTYGHQSPVGCASYQLPGRHGILFIALFGLHYNGAAWLCLAGPDSPLFPSDIERRPDLLKRAALMAKQNCTTRIAIDIADYLGDDKQECLIVEGSLSTDPFRQLQSHRVNLSLGLDCGPAQTMTDMQYDSSDAADDDSMVVATSSPARERSVSPPPLDHPALAMRLSTTKKRELRRRRYKND